MNFNVKQNKVSLVAYSTFKKESTNPTVMKSPTEKLSASAQIIRESFVR